MRPIHAIFLVLLFMGAVLGADFVLDGGFSRSRYKLVHPERGLVRIDISDLEASQVRFFRFLNAGNQEVKFFVGRDGTGDLKVAFDANELCHKLKRGYRHEGEWIVCNKCDRSFELSKVNEGRGGCDPVPIEFQLASGSVVMTENAILQGWRYFR